MLAALARGPAQRATVERMDLRSVLIEVHRALSARSIDHALIGGLALAAHGAARATSALALLVDGARADEIDGFLASGGFERLHRTRNVANYASRDPAKGRIDLLFANRERGRAMLARAAVHEILGHPIQVVDAADLIGLKVQAYSNDPSRRLRDLADVERLLASATVDVARAREYFRLFDREKELDELLAGGLEP